MDAPKGSGTVFLDLLKNDHTWRSKVLKVLQYSARLAGWVHESGPQSSSMTVAVASLAISNTVLPTEERCKEISKSLGIARRVSTLGDGMLAARELLITMAETQNISQLIFAFIDAFAGLLDDISTYSKVGLWDPKKLPPHFARVVNVSWAIQSAAHLYQSLVKLLVTYASRPKVEEGSERSLRPSAAFVEPVEDAAASASWRKEITLAWLQVSKCICDTCQALPSALEIKNWPELLEILFGLLSGILASTRVWLAVTVA